MSNVEHGRIVVIIYLCLLLVMVIINMIVKIDILSIIYFITLFSCFYKYLIVSKE